MMNYITKDNSSPNGKSRIWLGFHGLIDEKFFIETRDEILENENCIIWYDEESYDSAELINMLEDMQLLVIPLNNRIMEEKSSILSDIIEFAVNNQISVMPVLENEISGGIYKRIFGDMQYLSKFEDASYGMSYSEKMQNHIASAVTDSELRKKIHDAFDGIVFLSYRKKDRQYARHVMQLIHKNPQFLRIAVWFDDFLIPGEDYNSAISDAIVSSDLFVLAVTPNIINETNYVMTEEYPRAVNAGKIILPVMCADTDTDKLKTFYKEITECIYEDDFYTALENALNKTQIRNRVPDAEALYLLGMAFYNGIYVEVDRPKGKELVEKSAEMGYIDAMKKISWLYDNDMTVYRDTDKAVYWKKAYIEALERELSSHETLEKVLDYMRELTDYCSVCLGAVHNETLYECSLKAIELCDRFSRTYDSSLFYRFYLEALGNISFCIIDMQEDFTFDLFSDKLKIDKEYLKYAGLLYENDKSVENLYLLTNAYSRLLDHITDDLSEECDPDDYSETIELCIEKCGRYIEELYSRGSGLNKIRALIIGTSYEKNKVSCTGEFSDMYHLRAAEYYLNRKRKDASEYYSDGWDIESLGDYYLKYEQYDSAADFYNKAIDIFSELPADDMNYTKLSVILRIMECQIRKADILFIKDLYDDAETLCRSIITDAVDAIRNYKAILTEHELNRDFGAGDVNNIFEMICCTLCSVLEKHELYNQMNLVRLKMKNILTELIQESESEFTAFLSDEYFESITDLALDYSDDEDLYMSLLESSFTGMTPDAVCLDEECESSFFDVYIEYCLKIFGICCEAEMYDAAVMIYDTAEAVFNDTRVFSEKQLDFWLALQMNYITIFIDDEKELADELTALIDYCTDILNDTEFSELCYYYDIRRIRARLFYSFAEISSRKNKKEYLKAALSEITDIIESEYMADEDIVLLESIYEDSWQNFSSLLFLKKSFKVLRKKINETDLSDDEYDRINNLIIKYTK